VRSLLLLAVNLVQVTFTFAIFYEFALGLDRQAALFGSVLVIGTLGLPDGAEGTHTAFVPLQVASDLFLIVVTVSVFLAHLPFNFSNQSASGNISEVPQPGRKLRDRDSGDIS
jgi:hypothetical protein